MPILMIYEPARGGFSVKELPPEAQMPYVRRFFFPVSDFAAGAFSALVWTDARALMALDALAAHYPAPFTVSCAFRRYPSVRNDGLCFSLVCEKPELLRACCLDMRLIASVSPPYQGGRALHVRAAVPQGGRAGVHILALQDALLHKGCYRGALSGTLCLETRRALQRLTNGAGNATIRKRGDLSWII